MICYLSKELCWIPIPPAWIELSTHHFTLSFFSISEAYFLKVLLFHFLLETRAFWRLGFSSHTLEYFLN